MSKWKSRMKRAPASWPSTSVHPMFIFLHLPSLCVILCIVMYCMRLVPYLFRDLFLARTRTCTYTQSLFLTSFAPWFRYRVLTRTRSLSFFDISSHLSQFRSHYSHSHHIHFIFGFIPSQLCDSFHFIHFFYSLFLFIAIFPFFPTLLTSLQHQHG